MSSNDLLLKSTPIRILMPLSTYNFMQEMSEILRLSYTSNTANFYILFMFISLNKYNGGTYQ